MFSAIWNAGAAMITGSRESWGSASSSESLPAPEQNFTRSSSNKEWRESDWRDYHADAGFSEDGDSGLNPWNPGTGNSKLFYQLLDDLDGLSTTDSAHRRRKAREIMSDFIFHPEQQGHTDYLHRGSQLRRSSGVDCVLRRPDMAAARDERTSRRASGDFTGLQVPSPKVSPEHRAARCRSGDFGALDILGSPKGSPQHQERPRGHLDRLQWMSHPPYGCTKENEDDSGYHTGNSSGMYSKRSPGQRTLTREDCRRRITSFNTNNHGLLMDPPEGDSDTFQGFIRVHMNLLRPINMCISLPPPTIYDAQQDDGSPSVEMTSFYLPKDSSKVIHISSTTTTQEVIRILLSKFHITDNPRKFALYEKTQEIEKTATMRRICDDEMPLQICLGWTDENMDNLDRNQFVLQDYDTGEILWEAFSLPELESFLIVLNREEFEYIEQVKTKFRLLKVQMANKLQDIRQKQNDVSSGKRKPVFV